MEGFAKRLMMAVIIALLAGVSAGLLLGLGPFDPIWPPCLFHQWTGWHCPGCGMTRATHACLAGDWTRAFRFNPLLMVLIPLAAMAGAWELIGWLRGKPMPLNLRVGKWLGWSLVGLLALFWVLRNVPQWPFTLLAPP